MLLKKKETKNQNMVVNHIRISQEMENKGKLSIEKDIMKFEKIATRFLNKVPGF